jgi:hypothetical protein
VNAERRELARQLAGAFLAGPWEPDAMVARAARMLGRRPAWLRPVVLEVLLGYRRAPLDRPRELLVWIPAHPAAHGFVAGRSAITHARAHAGRRVVVRLDLEDFFAGVTAARVYGIFRTAGYPEAVAHALTGLCTNVVPLEHSVPEHFRLARRLATPHLPQGAPTSPALANLAAFRLDRRLSGLAAALGATYTRYADDLVLSCDHRLRMPEAMIAEIAAAEGFRVNRAKTRVMSRAARQTVTGIVVNQRLNVPRREYDTLKAILHNGGAGLDLAHLEGRVSWVESLNPARGAKLRARLNELKGV